MGRWPKYAILVNFLCSSVIELDSPTLANKDQPGCERCTDYGNFLGCFAQGCFQVSFSHDFNEDYVIDNCTSLCQIQGYLYANVQNETKCECACTLNSCAEPNDEKECGLPCPGALDKFCGGKTAGQIYKINLKGGIAGNCTQTLTDPSDSGSIVIVVAVAIVIVIIGVVSGLVCRYRDSRKKVVNGQHPTPSTAPSSASPRPSSASRGATSGPSGHNHALSRATTITSPSSNANVDETYQTLIKHEDRTGAVYALPKRGSASQACPGTPSCKQAGLRRDYHRGSSRPPMLKPRSASDTPDEFTKPDAEGSLYYYVKDVVK